MQRRRSLYSCLIAFLVCFSFFNQPVQPAAAGSGSSSWGSGHSLPGVNGQVTAMIYDNGKTYVAGDFTTAGGSLANHIAVWDGTRWQGLATGATGTINALALDDSGNLYAGGNFTQIDGVTANDLAVRSPSTGQWSEFGGGVQGSDGVKALRFDSVGSRLYVGGDLHTFGASAIMGIGYWDFTSEQWNKLGNGYAEKVQAIEIANDTVFIGGHFQGAAGILARNIVQYDIKSGVWSAMGTGLYGPVYALKYFNGSLYAGGGGNNYSSSPEDNSIARWDGASWNDVGGGLNGWVYALGAAQGTLYAVGSFTKTVSPGISTNNIAAWDGTNWSALNAEVNIYGSFQAVVAYPVTSNGVTENHLAVGGSFGDINKTLVANIAGMTAAGVYPLEDPVGPETQFNGFASEVKAMARGADGTLYAASCDSTLRVLRLDGTRWSLVGDRFPGVCSSYNYLGLAVGLQNQIYFSGTFNNMDDPSLPTYTYVWRLDGLHWTRLGGNFNGRITKLLVNSSGFLYAAGLFSAIDNVSTTRVVRWNGTSWSPVGGNFNGGVYDLAESPVNGYLYAAGDFTQTSDGPANNIALYDFDSSWHPLGSGTNDAIYNIAIDKQNKIYVGGKLTTAGGQSAQRIAYFDTITGRWNSMGSGANNIVNALGVDRFGQVYAGGSFTMMGGQSAQHVARWNGSTWSALDGGIASLRPDPSSWKYVINAILPSASDTYFAGDFYQAGDVVSNNIASFEVNSKRTFIPFVSSK